MKYITLLFVSLLFVRCNSSKNENSIIQNQPNKESLDSEKSLINEQKTTSAYREHYRRMINQDIGKLVSGDGVSSNSIYEIEVTYGMGLVSYIYCTKCIDGYPEALTSLDFHWSCCADHIEYTIKDQNEIEIEHFSKEINTQKVNAQEFEIIENNYFEKAKEFALKNAESILNLH
jgi:hypothetical protein